MGRLDGKVAIVTGGASGMGAGTVRRFVAEGARVLIADLLDDNGKTLIEELGDRALYLHTDVTREADVRDAVETAVANFGRLDCIFNNAGAVGVTGAVEETSVEGWDETMALLVRGVFLGMKHAAPVMKRQGAGSIINTASVAGLRAGFGPLCYSAAKAAVIHLSTCGATELGEHGVRVNAICPGGIVTPIFGRALGLSQQEAEQRLEAVGEIFAHMQPVPRPGQPTDIASAAVFLASDESGFVNGHALVVDGGLVAGRRASEVQQLAPIFRQALGLPPEEPA